MGINKCKQTLPIKLQILKWPLLSYTSASIKYTPGTRTRAPTLGGLDPTPGPLTLMGATILSI
nr:hypothetical protein MACL_00002027 [Theileria orientalis]